MRGQHAAMPAQTPTRRAADAAEMSRSGRAGRRSARAAHRHAIRQLTSRFSRDGCFARQAAKHKSAPLMNIYVAFGAERGFAAAADSNKFRLVEGCASSASLQRAQSMQPPCITTALFHCHSFARYLLVAKPPRLHAILKCLDTAMPLFCWTRPCPPRGRCHYFRRKACIRARAPPGQRRKYHYFIPLQKGRLGTWMRVRVSSVSSRRFTSH